MELKICYLYPDVLTSNGDTGNVLCLVNRCRWRGIEASLTEVSLDDKVALSDFDLIYLGGCQDFEKEELCEALCEGRAEEIRTVIEAGMPVLAVCGGYQMLGKSYESADGNKWDMIGALDCYTVEKARRLTGNCMFSWEDQKIVGFENHSGHSYLGEGLLPLGSVLVGHGNNGADGTEGARYKNVFATYAHGPLLPKNPAFCDGLLKLALERKYGEVSLAPLDDGAETMAHDEMVERLSK